jgi:hypothetical protein
MCFPASNFRFETGVKKISSITVVKEYNKNSQMVLTQGWGLGRNMDKETAMYK